MGRQVALIRGINVGKAKRVVMADLRALVEGLGCADVRTLLNSGNVVYTVPDGFEGDPAARIEAGLVGTLGVSARVLTATAEEVAEVVAGDPFEGLAHDPSRYLVAFLADPADVARLEPLAGRDWSPDALALGRRVAYMWCPRGLMESELPAAVGRVVGPTSTTRNWATVARLHALLNAP